MTGVDGQDFASAEVAKGGNWIATVRQDWPTIATTARWTSSMPTSPARNRPRRRCSSRRVLITSENACIWSHRAVRLRFGRRPAMILAGFDVGTTAVKGVYLDARDGAVVAEASWEYELRRPREGYAEQDPADWLAGLLCVPGSARRRRSGIPVAAIGICSQVNTHVFVDADLAPLHPAINWQDQRCAEAGRELERRAGDDLDASSAGRLRSMRRTR